MWLLPSRRRPANLKRFFEACQDVGLGTPGRILIDKSDYSDLRTEYSKLNLPTEWQIIVTERESMGDKVRDVWPQVENLEWLGIINDDVHPRTHGWDKKLVSALNGWNFVSCNDGWHAPRRAAGALVYSGPLLRATGWMFPDQLYHLYHDDVWEELGRATDGWQIQMDVVVEHRHATREMTEDETHAKGHDRWAEQDAAYRTWKKNDFTKTLQRIYQLKKELLHNQPYTGTRMHYWEALEYFHGQESVKAVAAFKNFLQKGDLTDRSARAASFVYLAFAQAQLNSPQSVILDCLFKAVREWPSASFPWAQVSSAMASIGDWPNCFSAALNAIRGQRRYSGLMDGEPWVKEEPIQYLKKSCDQLGISGDESLSQVIGTRVNIEAILHRAAGSKIL